VSQNSSSPGGPVAGFGGGISFLNSNALLVNVIISNNTASGGRSYNSGQGGGIGCSNSSLSLSNVTINNNTSAIGGGLCIGSPQADYTSNIIFDPINRCNIFNNLALSGVGSDLSSDSDSITVIVDTFTVLNPDTSHAYPLNKFTFDILHDTSGISNVHEKTNNVLFEFKLKQNYPNPFNPTTTIEFSIPNAEFVTLKIYNLLGQEVATLVSDKFAPGIYKYTWDASGFASGVYLYKIDIESFVKTCKMILMQ